MKKQTMFHLINCTYEEGVEVARMFGKSGFLVNVQVGLLRSNPYPEYPQRLSVGSSTRNNYWLETCHRRDLPRSNCSDATTQVRNVLREQPKLLPQSTITLIFDCAAPYGLLQCNECQVYLPHSHEY